MQPMLAECTALCVDDEPLIAAEMAKAFQDIGFGTVLVAYCLQSARAEAAMHKIDFALLDVNLGGECSTGIGKALAQGGTRVVFASGYAKAELGAALQGFDFLEKPIGGDDIGRHFRALLNRAGVRRFAAE